MDKEIVLAIVAILATCVGGLIWVIKYLFQKILPVIEQLVKATDKNTETTKHADEYLRERNGRDSKMHKEVLDGMRAIRTAVEAK